MPAPLPTPRKPFFPPDPPRRKYKKLAIYLAIGVAVVFVPLTLRFQNQRFQNLKSKSPPAPTAQPTPPKTIEETGDQSVPAEIRQWHMTGVDGITETQARKRFGTPIFVRDFNVTYGAFLGPRFGLKHYYLTSSPGYEEREKASQLRWNYPQYNTIREMIWKMRESYLTLWLHEPQVEVSLDEEAAELSFPRTGGDWVVIDNYRVGQDLVKNPPVSTSSPTATP